MNPANNPSHPFDNIHAATRVPASQLQSEHAALTAQVEANEAEWAVVMADVHDYYKDERADRGHGRARLLLTLLGQMRCERDDARAQVEGMRKALEQIKSLDFTRAATNFCATEAHKIASAALTAAGK